MASTALAFFIFSLLVFFVAIALTLILGAVSRTADKRVEREGRPSRDQRPPMEGDVTYP
jgi:hypothetical protein